MVIKRPRIETNEEQPVHFIQTNAVVVHESDTTYPLVITPWLLDISEHPDSVLQFEIANLSNELLEIEIVDKPDDIFVLDIPSYVDAGDTISCGLSLLPGAGDQKFTKSFTIELSDSSRTRFTVPVRRTF